MEQQIYKGKLTQFHWLKIAKKEDLTKNTFSLELEIPENLKEIFTFEAGQFVSIKFKSHGEEIINDYSMTSAPYEQKISLGIKVGSTDGATSQLYENYQVGDDLLVSVPNGRFTLISKPSEFRTIVGFAGGIGITPILSHFKNILHNEPRTRLFLFFGNKNSEELIYRELLDNLARQYNNRLHIFYFYSQEKTPDRFFYGRLDAKKLNLIINQILHLDDTDEEATIWDAVDEVLICGKGEMIKTLANACYHHGIRKANIHFELFEEFNDDIYPVEIESPLIENVQIDFKMLGKKYQAELPNNREKILQQLLVQNFPVPYSCKSGICGSCECTLEEGEVELLENEYLTEKEEAQGKILACMSIAKTKKIKLNFDFN
ncbi:flavin reductase family protein [Chryseobacterium chendengshani]|uniref:flavin reductase family protein n=1 Tax=unclassified Chryseobacterium TaxID=2593645 RepID=UPI001C644902|nr:MULTISPECIES: iron-sulfur cluster-binding domain-containing protein [unclassified Chryseobacterium]MBW7674467.1 iron-sulfur cluster-binding domain-containing protein [Chryseobacterium sp. LJ756]MBW8522741.1 iron-sulfur cluster-binding domain-containing protein [Chryseobacterium sp. LJ668]QYK16275.1 iron-sulfur cluster-binding domain-containing protein [Chryseobacterium sp. LJ668]